MKPPILIFPFNLMAHYLRCIVLADAFRERYSIVFASGSYDELLNRHGYQTDHVEHFDAERTIEHAHRFDFSWMNEDDIERVFLSQVSLIKKYQPAFVIGDTSPTLKIAAEFTGTPYIALMNGYMSSCYAFTRKLPPVHPAYKYQQKLPEHVFDPVIWFAEKIAFRMVHKPFRRIRKKYKLHSIASYLKENEGDQTIICDSTNLFPLHKIPESFHLAGPLIYEGGQELGDVPDDKPVIYVSMGSSGNWNNVRFLNDQLFSSFTIITAGDHQRILDKDHIIPSSFINPSSILKKASLVICHGGNGTIYQALKYDVPVLVSPSYFEQYYNLHAIERTGSGELLNASSPRSAYEQACKWIKEKNSGYRTKSAIRDDIRSAAVNLKDAVENISMHHSHNNIR